MYGVRNARKYGDRRHTLHQRRCRLRALVRSRANELQWIRISNSPTLKSVILRCALLRASKDDGPSVAAHPSRLATLAPPATTAKPLRGDDGPTRVRILATPGARGLQKSFAPLKGEGAGNAGCALHPRSRVQCAQGSAHTSIQGSGEHPTFPAQWLYGLLRALPGRAGLVVTVAALMLPPAQLDASIRGVRTTRLRRTLKLRSSVATSASTATRPSFVTMANAPLSGTGWLLM